MTSNVAKSKNHACTFWSGDAQIHMAPLGKTEVRATVTAPNGHYLESTFARPKPCNAQAKARLAEKVIERAGHLRLHPERTPAGELVLRKRPKASTASKRFPTPRRAPEPARPRRVFSVHGASGRGWKYLGEVKATTHDRAIKAAWARFPGVLRISKGPHA